MRLKHLLAGQIALQDLGDAPLPEGYLSVPGETALFHVTHWKAGSQWMKGILGELFGPAMETPQYHVRHVWANPIKAGRVYPCVYAGKPEFDSLTLEGGKRSFVVIRDLRDTLISAYYSLRNTHEVKVDEIAHYRQMLRRLNQEQGLLYLMDTWLGKSARIQRTWLEAGVQCFRLEDCMGNAPDNLSKMFARGWGLDIHPELIERVATRHSFAKLAGGRHPGTEDLNSHYRKGVAGDWKTHFSIQISDRFKTLYNDLLLRAGYESKADWTLETVEAPTRAAEVVGSRTR